MGGWVNDNLSLGRKKGTSQVLISVCYCMCNGVAHSTVAYAPAATEKDLEANFIIPFVTHPLVLWSLWHHGQSPWTLGWAAFGRGWTSLWPSPLDIQQARLLRLLLTVLLAACVVYSVDHSRPSVCSSCTRTLQTLSEKKAQFEIVTHTPRCHVSFTSYN